jgi:putative tricarboxylic transport membrane protein
MPLIVLFSVVGAISVRGSFFDVWVMLAFGLMGYVMTRTSFPTAPMVLTLLLGPRLEAEFRRSLVLSGGSPAYLLERPIALGLLLVVVVAVAIIVWRKLLVRSQLAKRMEVSGRNGTRQI